MMNGAICKHNQRGFCKFKLFCRNKHENTLCPKEDTSTSRDSIFRHPKVCKNYTRHETCRFNDQCAYKHEKDSDQKINIKELIKNHEKDIGAIKDEMNQLKAIISQMGKQILILNQNLENINKINVQEVVEIVVKTLDNSKGSVKPSQEERDSDLLFQCDMDSKKGTDNKHVDVAEHFINCEECSFNSSNEWTIIRHMSKEHPDILKKYCSCDEFGTYFGTRYLLKVHNEKEHSHNEQDEDSATSESEMSNYDCNNCPAKFKDNEELQRHIHEKHGRKISKKQQRNKKK